MEHNAEDDGHDGVEGTERRQHRGVRHRSLRVRQLEEREVPAGPPRPAGLRHTTAQRRESGFRASPFASPPSPRSIVYTVSAHAPASVKYAGGPGNERGAGELEGDRAPRGKGHRHQAEPCTRPPRLSTQMRDGAVERNSVCQLLAQTWQAFFPTGAW
jgi:hypothetical protein